MMRRARTEIVLLAAASILAPLAAAVSNGALERSWFQFTAGAIGAELVGAEGVVRQGSRNDCGPAALCNLFNLLGIACTPQDARLLVDPIGPRGTSLLDLKNAARKHGLELVGRRLPQDRLALVSPPVLVPLRQKHFVVVVKVVSGRSVEVIDPAIGRLRFPIWRFQKLWTGEFLARHRFDDPTRDWPGASGRDSDPARSEAPALEAQEGGE